MKEKTNKKEQQECVEAYKRAFQAAYRDEAPSKEEVSRMLSSLNARIEKEEVRTRTGNARKISPVRRVLRVVAAAAAVVALAVVGWWQFSGPSADSRDFVAENSTEEVMQVSLPDGSSVCLKRGASVVFARVEGLRRVTLEGEAFFDVVRDTLHPFVVSTDALDVKVLGTAFSVNAMPGAEQTDVILERGSVRLLSKEGSPLIRLVPNQKAVYVRESGDIAVEAVYAGPMIQNQFNLISFEDATIDEILRTIEENFGVKIEASGYDETLRYHLSFLRSDSLEDVFALLGHLTGGDFTALVI